MKNLFKIAWAMIAAVVFFACSEDGIESTAPQLKAFGPNPALRGSEMTFVGENLDPVIAVVFPGNIKIEDLLRENGDKTKFKIVVPQQAEPGIIELLLAGGSKLTAKGELTFTEPITITGITPSPLKRGQTLTIEGDYLNLIQKVVFAEEIEVKCQNFTTWTREKIELVLPAEARTGTIILADTAEIPFELKSETALQVVLPSVDETLTQTGIKPGEQISAAGKDLDLVVTVEMPDGTSVPFDILNNTLTFTLPNNISNGAVVMIPASGVRVIVRNIDVAAPDELEATPAAGLRAGDEITVSGTNLDLVTTVTFAGIDNPVTPTVIEPGRIKVAFPEGAQSGDLVLNTASGKTGSVHIETLKPVFAAYNPNPVSAGENVEIQGENLDLVASVTFGGNKNVDVTATSSASLTVKVPTNAETGEITLTMANGESVTTETSLTVDKPLVAYIPVMPEGEIAAGSVWQVEITNEDKLTGIEWNGTTMQYVLSGNNLYIGIPSGASGDNTLKLVSSNGDISYIINVKANGAVETVIYTGPTSTGSWSGYAQIEKEKFANATVGSIIHVKTSDVEAGAQGSFKDGATWSEIATGTDYFDITGNFDLEITPEILEKLQSSGLIVGGQKYTIEDVSIIIM
ncbi:MAG: IPT/TIG domain-containing protein [Dysgonamonadaceae bacterium]|jgi:hypothetical protein|nr:IPT/TIG domain-containing protein [Dysgonamonadaceae bacterium]